MNNQNIITVISSNIRFDNPADGDHDWNSRRKILADYLNSSSADLIGTQEGRRPQLEDLLSLLPAHQMSHAHRNWIEERMYPTIYFNSDNIKVLDSGDIWLSETPHIAGSLAFESNFPRLCTWINAIHIPSGHNFFYVNTHLDHVHSHTREMQIEVLLNEITKQNKENLPLILTGDFNESPMETVRKKIKNYWPNLIDPWETFNKTEHSSFHKFGPIPENGARIDWILHDNKYVASSIDIYTDHHQGIYPSDHFPVKASINLPV